MGDQDNGDGFTVKEAGLYEQGYTLGKAEAGLARLTTDMAHQYLNGMRPDPAELKPRSILSGEWGGESWNELGITNEDEANAYEQGYREGWEAMLFDRSTDLLA